jgi:phosphoribosyl 1,2-cyclic phosphate phosphodiesterase
VPNFEFVRIDLRPFEVLGLELLPVRLIHGRLPILGFRMHDVAFCTDASEIPEESWPRLEGLDVLVLGALRDKPHPTHFNLEQALEAIERLRPRRAFLTHLSTELDYEETNRRLPPHIRLAYDGLRIRF